MKKYTASYTAYFDTYTEITLYTRDKAAFSRFSDMVRDELSVCHKLFDIYHEYEGLTNLCTLNKKAATSPVPVDERILGLLSFAKQVYGLTEGKTNIALGSVLSIWHDHRETGTELPPKERLEAAAEHTDICDLIIDTDAGTVYFADPDLCLDVGAVAKGYASERVRQMLLDAGYTDFLLNIGGSVLGAGKKPDGSPYRIGVENPDGSDNFIATVTVADSVVSVSGDYQRYYEVGGVRYCHIIDPDTLFPARYFSSVTVVAENAALADALSTALFCMTREDGTALLSRTDGAEAMWVTQSGEVFRSDGFPAE